MTKAKPSTVRFYVDADLLGVAQVLANLRADLTYPGDPGAEINKRKRTACPIASSAAKDTEWIPIVAAQGWLVITRDRNIHERPLELASVRHHGAKMNQPRRQGCTRQVGAVGDHLLPVAGHRGARG